MDPLVLAKCWALDDGTTCLLSKVGAAMWELRVSRGAHLLRVELFGDLLVAVVTARAWRAVFSSEAENIA